MPFHSRKMKVFLGSLTASLYAASALATRQPPVSVNIIPGPVAAGPSTAQFTSLASGFDAPKLSSVNNTVFDWWYFDAVSSNLKGSAVLIPFTSGATGLWTGMPDMGATTWFAAVFTLANGTGVEFFLPATSLTVVTTDDGSSGAFGGLNVDWFGAPDMSTYVLTVDEPEAGIQGSLTLRSVISSFSIFCEATLTLHSRPLLRISHVQRLLTWRANHTL